MKKFDFTTIGIICFCLLCVNTVSAQKKDLNFQRSPFTSQLPLPPPPKEVPQTPGSPIIDEEPAPPPEPPPPPPPPEIILPALDVQGLIWNSDRPQAIINEQVVDEGQVLILDARINSQQPAEGEDQYLKIKIIKIAKSEILVEYKEKLFKVKP